MNVGQILYFVPDNLRRPGHAAREVTVTKIGHKWLTLDNGQRCDKDTLEVDGGQYSSPGRCWLTKEAYEQYVTTTAVWLQFRRCVESNMRAPAGVTTERIYEAAKALGFGMGIVQHETPDTSL